VAATAEVISGIGTLVDVDAVKTKIDAVVDGSNKLIVSKVNDAITEGGALYGTKITGTTSGSADTETSHAHGLGRVPTMIAIIPTATTTDQIYESKAADATYIYVKCHSTSITFAAYCN
jgi:hypothetical protein